MTKIKIAAVITAMVVVGGLLYANSNLLTQTAFAGANMCVPGTPGCDGLGVDSCGMDPFTGQLLVIQHWDKIIFENEEDLLDANENIIEEDSIMDIKVLDDPNAIEFPMQKAVDKLNGAGWTTEDGDPITLDDLELIDVEYAIACSSTDFGLPNNQGT